MNLLFALFLFSLASFQQEIEKFDKNFDTSFIQVGEELVYEVSYLFFKLGQVSFKVMDKFTEKGNEFYRIRVKVNSYPIPFVSMNATFDVTFDSKFISRRYRSEQHERKYYQSVRYHLIESLPAYVVEKNYHNLEYNTKGYKLDTIRISTMYCDGPSLFYYARSNYNKKRSIIVPTFVEGIRGTTLINFAKNKTKIKIEALEKAIDAYELDGKANYIGFFGLTGDFVGWISADERAIPLKGKLKVIVGSVIVELKRWSGPWKPAEKTKT